MKNELSKRLVKNARYIIKATPGLKVREAEKRIGRNPGYFSRLDRDGCDAGLSVDSAFAIAEYVGKTVDSLCHDDYSDTAKRMQIAEMEDKIRQMQEELKELKGDGDV